MAKLLILTAAILAAGVDEISNVLAAEPAASALDVLSLVDENNELQSAFDALKKINAELAEQIHSAAPAAEQAEIVKPTLSDKTFTINDVKYGFAYPALNLDGTIITNDDVLADEALQLKLVEMESGFIKAV